MTRAAAAPDGAVEDFESIRGEVAITGIGESDHTGPSGRDAKDIAAQAIGRAIEDAGLTPRDIDGIMWAPWGGGEFTDEDFRAHFGTTHDMWASREGGATRFAATAPYFAAQAIREGKARHIVNSFSVAWATQRPKMVGGPGQIHAENRMKQNLEVPAGMFPQPVYAALMARRHMGRYGTTSEHLGSVAVTMRAHANKTPGAVMEHRTMTLDDYLASHMVADPIRKYDCCLISDGGGAFVMSPADVAKDMPHPVIEVAGSGLARSEARSYWSLQDDITTTPVRHAAPAALAMAGMQLSDIDVLSLYDPFTIITLFLLEDLGFCEKGESGPFVKEGSLLFDGGAIPTNTHGGLHSHAYVLGIAHMVEIVRQLRGTAGAQVEDAEVAAYAASIGPEGSMVILRRA